MTQIKLLFAMAILVALTILTVYVPKDFSSVPPMVILVSSLFIGAAFSAVLGIAENLKLGGEIKKKKKEVEESSEKIKSLQLKIRELEEKTEEGQSDKSEREQGI
ncbi:DUF1049 domain-containing protein [bacterium]|nr:DUF1049 domain-containing protein [bacterium]MBU3956023.1 DUF1049 domain-containing protein [bacterium]